MECHVCYNPYNTSSRKPKNLPCGHTYCAECLTKLLNQSTSTITCPGDRTECKVPNKNIEQLTTNFAILDLLRDECLDCHEKPQDGPCLPEHCSKRLCSDCKASHLKKFSVELVAELQAMKTQFTEKQAICDDDNDFTRMDDQSKAAIAEVTRVFDAEKEKMIQAITKKQEIGSSNYFQWKKNFNLCLAQSRSTVNKVLLEIRQTSDRQSGKFLSDLKKQLTQEKEAISGVEDTKEQLPLFDASEVQKIFDGMMPALYESVMPLFPDYTAAQFSQSYGKEISGAGVLKGPCGISVAPVTGNLAVSDYLGHKIHILTSNLQPVSDFGTKGSGQDQLKYPAGVCFSSTGNLFIADQANHRIMQVTEGGRHIGTRDLGQLLNPSGISWESGLLYICEWNNYRLHMMKESGENVRSVGRRGLAPGQFPGNPWFAAVSGSHDKLVVSDFSGNLNFFSLDGQHRRTIRAGQPPYNIKAGGVMIDKFGHVIVSDHKEGCLVVLGEDKVIATIRLPAGERMSNPQGVTMTSDGSIIVCDNSKRQIHKFTVPRHKQTNTCA